MADDLMKLQSDIEALATLRQHPGWQLLTERYKLMSNDALSHMRLAKDPAELAMWSTRYLGLRDVPEAVDALLQTLRMSYENLSKMKAVNR